MPFAPVCKEDRPSSSIQKSQLLRLNIIHYVLMHDYSVCIVAWWLKMSVQSWHSFQFVVRRPYNPEHRLRWYLGLRVEPYFISGIFQGFREDEIDPHGLVAQKITRLLRTAPEHRMPMLRQALRVGDVFDRVNGCSSRDEMAHELMHADDVHLRVWSLRWPEGSAEELADFEATQPDPEPPTPTDGQEPATPTFA